MPRFVASQSVGLPQNQRLHLILINGGVRPVNKFEALVQVAREFDAKRKPFSALCAVLIVSVFARPPEEGRSSKLIRLGVPSALTVAGILLLR